MQAIVCSHCSSTNFEMSKFKRRNSNGRFSLLRCKDCGMLWGVLDTFQVCDLIRQRDSSKRKIARELLDRMVV